MRPLAMECLGENTVADLLAAQLSPERRAEIDAHTATCEDCRRLISELMRRSLAYAATATERTAPRSVVPGMQIGRYLVREQIGRGAMGAVFAAYDPELDRVIAIKLLHPGSVAQRDRIYREARAMGRLAHPNVVAAFDVGAHGDELFIAMELVAGLSLRAWTAHARTTAEILDVFGQAARGLAAAHAGGLVHRDFKPDNALVGSDGRVRIVDFGLAAGADGGTELCGTPAYMAPEQLEVGGADPASDQFAFCVALYEALYGARPFAVNLIAEVARGLPRRTTREVPANLIAVLARGLAVDPAARFPSMTALADALGARAPRRARTIYAAIGIAGMSAAVAAGVAALVAMRAPAPAPVVVAPAPIVVPPAPPPTPVAVPVAPVVAKTVPVPPAHKRAPVVAVPAVVSPPSPTPGQQGWPAVYQVNGKPAAHRPDPGHAGVVAATVRELGYTGLDRSVPISTLNDAAFAADPDAPFAAVALGMAKRAHGDCAGAAPIWRDAIALLVRRRDDAARLWSARASFGLGLCALTAGHFAEAKDQVSRAWVNGGVQDEVNVALAVIAYEVGDQLQSYAMFTVTRQKGGAVAQRALQTWLDQTGLAIGP